MFYYNIGDGMNNVELEKYLIANDHLLKDKNVRDILFEPSNHYVFVWVVQGIDNFAHYCDDDMVNRILNDVRCRDKLNAIITSSKNIGSFLNDDRVLDKVFSFDLSAYFYNLNYSSAIPVLKYMFKNGLERYFVDLAGNVQNVFLSDKRVCDFLFNSDKIFYLFSRVNNDGLNILLSYEKGKNLLLNSNPNNLYRLVNSNAKFPLDVCYDKRFINCLLDVQSITEYRNLINRLEVKNNVAVEIDELREKKYDSIISNYIDGYSELSRKIISDFRGEKNVDSLINNDLKIFALKENNNIDVKLLYKYDSVRFKEILIDRFFKDIPLNFLKNLKIMINYIDLSINSNNKIEFIDNNRYNIYKKILDFDNLMFDERMELYEECKKIKNFSSLFYDDYRFCRDHSYSSLVNSAINFNSTDNDINMQMSERSGVKVYELKGEDFFAFVHSTFALRDLVADPNIWRTGNREYMSLSYIGSDNLSVYRNPYEYVVLGFSGLDIKRIGHLYESDSYTEYGYGNADISSRIQKMYNSKDFVNNTRGYNEIAYLEDSKDIPLSKIMPSYVVCYDYITDGELMIAKNYNIPIVLIDTKKYKFNNAGVMCDDSDKYVL